jgi:hypothetical protein
LIVSRLMVNVGQQRTETTPSLHIDLWWGKSIWQCQQFSVPLGARQTILNGSPLDYGAALAAEQRQSHARKRQSDRGL